MKMKPTYSQWRLLATGAVTIVLGVFLFLFQTAATREIIDWLTGYFFLNGLIGLMTRLAKNKEHREPLSAIWTKIGLSLIISILNYFTNAPVHLLVRFIGLYQLLVCGINGVTYWLFRQNNVRPRGRFLFDALIYGSLAIGAIMTPGEESESQFLVLGIYLIFLGCAYFRDGWYYNSKREYRTFKRRFRLSLPIVVVALIPHKMLRKLNSLLQETDVSDLTADVVYNSQKRQAPADLEVLIHVTDSGFGAMGHVDICYRNQVISYGCYDTDSERLGGAIGDGVLFETDRDAYIAFCQRVSNKTLFGYGVMLDAAQKAAIEQQIAQLKSWTVPWQPPATVTKQGSMKHQPMYAALLQQQTGAQLYKFTQSRFKTYFVLSTNCVLLADTILGQAGTDVLSVRGFISPGTYQDFLEREYSKPHSMVVSRFVYQQKDVATQQVL